MRKKDESVTLKILRKMYPYYDKDYDVDIMDILWEYYNDLLHKESNIPPNTELFKEAIVLIKIRGRCLHIESHKHDDDGLILLAGDYRSLGSNLTGIGAPVSLDKIHRLDNLTYPIKGQLTKKGYLYIKEIIESEKRTKIERNRFWLTAMIAILALVCTALQTYTAIQSNKNEIDLKREQYKISRTVDSLRQHLHATIK